MRGTSLSLLALAALANPAFGQAREIDRIAPFEPDERFGHACAALGDLDGDGVSEFAIGATFGGTGVDFGRVYVFSGRDRSVLRVHDGKSLLWTNSENYGWSVTSIGDITADGVRDYVIFAPTSMRFEAISGADGALIQEVFVSGLQGQGSDYKGIVDAGDLDGDGLDDLIVPHAVGGGGQRGRVLAYSTATWGTLWGIYGENTNDHFGGFVQKLGDADGDGTSDFLIAAPLYPHFVGDGAVYAYSGATQAQLWKIEGSTQSRMGHDLGVVPDLDGDGVDEALIPRTTVASFLQFVEVRSGADGTLLTTFTPSSPSDSAGLDLGPPTDVDGDGDLDALIAGYHVIDSQHFEQLLFAWEPRDGATLARALPGFDGNPYSAPIESLGDVDGDSFNDVLITTENQDAVLLTFRSPPAITSITPSRGPHAADTPITITGSGFALAQSLTVDLGGTPASDALVVDDATLTCTVPSGEPGPIAITVTHDAGTATLENAFVRTPATLLDGDFARGGTLTVRTLCAVGDTLFGIVGVPPEVAIPMPPYAGALRILPLTLLSLQSSFAGDEFDLVLAIPDDPALVGLEFLFQSLAGPQLGGPAKQGAWTNCATLSIE